MGGHDPGYEEEYDPGEGPCLFHRRGFRAAYLAVGFACLAGMLTVGLLAYCDVKLCGPGRFRYFVISGVVFSDNACEALFLCPRQQHQFM